MAAASPRGNCCNVSESGHQAVNLEEPLLFLAQVVVHPVRKRAGRGQPATVAGLTVLQFLHQFVHLVVFVQGVPGRVQAGPSRQGCRWPGQGQDKLDPHLRRGATQRYLEGRLRHAVHRQARFGGGA